MRSRTRAGAGRSLGSELFGCFSSGVDGPAHEVGDQLEFGVGVVGEERVHRSAEPGVEAEKLAVAVADSSHEDGSAVGWVSFAEDPTAFLQAVENSGHRRRVNAGALGECGGTERAVGVEDVQAIEVDVFELDS
jgi:hypothetical protein